MGHAAPAINFCLNRFGRFILHCYQVYTGRYVHKHPTGGGPGRGWRRMVPPASRLAHQSRGPHTAQEAPQASAHKSGSGHSSETCNVSGSRSTQSIPSLSLWTCRADASSHFTTQHNTELLPARLPTPPPAASSVSSLPHVHAPHHRPPHLLAEVTELDLRRISAHAVLRPQLVVPQLLHHLLVLPLNLEHGPA